MQHFADHSGKSFSIISHVETDRYERNEMAKRNKDYYFWKEFCLSMFARSSYWWCSVKTGVLKNFAIFTRKHIRCAKLSK